MFKLFLENHDIHAINFNLVKFSIFKTPSSRNNNLFYENKSWLINSLNTKSLRIIFFAPNVGKHYISAPNVGQH